MAQKTVGGAGPIGASRVVVAQRFYAARKIRRKKKPAKTPSEIRIRELKRKTKRIAREMVRESGGTMTLPQAFSHAREATSNQTTRTAANENEYEQMIETRRRLIAQPPPVRVRSYHRELYGKDILAMLDWKQYNLVPHTINDKYFLPSYEPTIAKVGSMYYRKAQYGLFEGRLLHREFRRTPKSKQRKIRRVKPNILKKVLFSRTLDRFVPLTVTAKALRTIDKCGGLDNYVERRRAYQIKRLGLRGIQLRYLIRQVRVNRTQLEDAGFLKPNDSLPTSLLHSFFWSSVPVTHIDRSLGTGRQLTNLDGREPGVDERGRKLPAMEA